MIETLTFTPAEAAKISGVNATLQRDWRRRKITRPLEGPQARFTPFEVAELMALGALAGKGLSPLSFKGVAGKLGACIVKKALTIRSAYMGPADLVLSLDMERLESIRGSRHDLDDHIWSWRAAALARSVIGREGHMDVDYDAFIQWAEGSFDFYRSLISPFEQIDDNDSRMAGAIVIVSLRALGIEFAKRAGPIVSVSQAFIDNQNGLQGFNKVRALLKEIQAEASHQKPSARAAG